MSRVSVISVDCHCRGEQSQQTNGRILGTGCSGMRTKDAHLRTTPRGATGVSRRRVTSCDLPMGGRSPHSSRQRCNQVLSGIPRITAEVLDADHWGNDQRVGESLLCLTPRTLQSSQNNPRSCRMRTTQNKARVLHTSRGGFDADDPGRESTRDRRACNRKPRR